MMSAFGHKARRSIIRLLGGALLLQAGGCMFDSGLFFSSSLTEIATNSSALFVTTILSELLKVTPSFSF